VIKLAAMFVMNWIAPKAAAQFELLLDEMKKMMSMDLSNLFVIMPAGHDSFEDFLYFSFFHSIGCSDPSKKSMFCHCLQHPPSCPTRQSLESGG